MADEKEEKSSNKVKKDVYIPQSAQDVQRMKIEKLMNNPVSGFELSSTPLFCEISIEFLCFRAKCFPNTAA